MRDFPIVAHPLSHATALTVSGAILEEHGGALQSVVSKKCGTYSYFVIELPLKKSKRPVSARAPTPVIQTPEQFSFSDIQVNVFRKCLDGEDDVCEEKCARDGKPETWPDVGPVTTTRSPCREPGVPYVCDSDAVGDRREESDYNPIPLRDPDPGHQGRDLESKSELILDLPERRRLDGPHPDPHFRDHRRVLAASDETEGDGRMRGTYPRRGEEGGRSIGMDIDVPDRLERPHPPSQSYPRSLSSRSSAAAMTVRRLLSQSSPPSVVAPAPDSYGSTAVSSPSFSIPPLSNSSYGPSSSPSPDFNSLFYGGSVEGSDSRIEHGSVMTGGHGNRVGVQTALAHTQPAQSQILGGRAPPPPSNYVDGWYYPSPPRQDMRQLTVSDDVYLEQPPSQGLAPSQLSLYRQPPSQRQEQPEHSNCRQLPSRGHGHSQSAVTGPPALVLPPSSSTKVVVGAYYYGGEAVEMRKDTASLTSSATVLSVAEQSRGNYAVNRELISSQSDLPGLLRVMVVDQSALTRHMIVQLLSKRCCQCDESHSGLSVVRRVQYLMERGEPVYDLILLDMILRQMDGSSTVMELRRIGYKGKIVGITGIQMPGEIQYFLNCGADRVLTKPLDLALFERTLRGALFKEEWSGIPVLCTHEGYQPV